MGIYLFWKNNAKIENFDKISTGRQRLCADYEMQVYYTSILPILSLLGAVKKSRGRLKLGAGIELYLVLLTETSIPIGNLGGEILKFGNFRSRKYSL